MKAIRAASVASLEEYAEVELPVPEPSPSEVRIKVAACGVGYVDALVALGRYQVKPPLPHVPGGEVSGWVDAVGAGVVGLAVGDRVMAQVRGGFAEQAIADAASVRRLPDWHEARPGGGLPHQLHDGAAWAARPRAPRGRRAAACDRRGRRRRPCRRPGRPPAGRHGDRRGVDRGEARRWRRGMARTSRSTARSMAGASG